MCQASQHKSPWDRPQISSGQATNLLGTGHSGSQLTQKCLSSRAWFQFSHQQDLGPCPVATLITFPTAAAQSGKVRFLPPECEQGKGVVWIDKRREGFLQGPHKGIWHTPQLLSHRRRQVHALCPSVPLKKELPLRVSRHSRGGMPHPTISTNPPTSDSS